MVYVSDLPTGALAHVSSFLPAPSRALFAVALNSRDSSSAIVGNQWDALDFGEIEKELAAKISDDDIRGVLLSINAVDKLKKLRLTNCINISGAGLEPLRGSTIIEKIDLSLVGDHKSPRLDPEPLISYSDVLPILDSIIERGEDCSLKHLMLPFVWRGENTEFAVHAFLTRYNEWLCSRAGCCLKCNCNLSNYDGDDQNMLYMSAGDDKFYGTQKYTCYDCTKQYCDDCEDGGVYYIGGSCDKCERIYCRHCKKVDFCTSCEEWFCVGCIDMIRCFQCEDDTCPDCVRGVRCHNNCCADKIWCNHCVENGDSTILCDRCSVENCVDCCESDIYAVKFCDVCKDSLCGQCRVKKCKEGRNCARCYQFSFPVISEDKDRMQTEMDELENENREQSNEINELRRKVKDLTGELDEV